MTYPQELPHILPGPTDRFEVKQIAEHVFKIHFETAMLKVKMHHPEKGLEKKGPTVQLLAFPKTMDMRFKKLMGYVISQIVPKYKTAL